MSAKIECGRFVGNNTTSQTVNLADNTLTPVAIILFSTPGGTEGSFLGTADFCMGFGTRRGGSTQQGSVGYKSEDNVATSDSARIRSTTTLLTPLATTSLPTSATVSLTGFAQGSFSLSYGVANSTLYYYIVFGGDITDAIVINQTMDSTGATQAITGTGFQPDALFCADVDSTAGSAQITSNLAFSFGFASSNSQFRSMAITETDGDTMTSAMNWNKSYRADACLERLAINADTSDARWDLDSFDSDGCTLGVVDAPSNTTKSALFLFLKGGVWEATSKTKRSGAGDDVFSLANTNLTPKGVVMFTTNQTAAGITAGNVDHDIGFGSTTDGTREFNVGDVGVEAINTQRDSFVANDHVLEELTGGTTPAETSRADLTAFSQGSFTINWAAGSATAIHLAAMVVGDTQTVAPLTLSLADDINT